MASFEERRRKLRGELGLSTPVTTSPAYIPAGGTTAAPSFDDRRATARAELDADEERLRASSSRGSVRAVRKSAVHGATAVQTGDLLQEAKRRTLSHIGAALAPESFAPPTVPGASTFDEVVKNATPKKPLPDNLQQYKDSLYTKDELSKKYNDIQSELDDLNKWELEYEAGGYPGEENYAKHIQTGNKKATLEKEQSRLKGLIDQRIAAEEYRKDEIEIAKGADYWQKEVKRLEAEAKRQRDDEKNRRLRESELSDEARLYTGEEKQRRLEATYANSGESADSVARELERAKEYYYYAKARSAWENLPERHKKLALESAAIDSTYLSSKSPDEILARSALDAADRGEIRREDAARKTEIRQALTDAGFDAGLILDYAQRVHDSEQKSKLVESLQQFSTGAEDASKLEKLARGTAGTAISAATNLLSGIGGVSILAQKAFGESGFEDYRPVNTDSGAFAFSHATTGIRSAVGGQMGKTGQFAYNTLNSVIDNAARMLVSKGVASGFIDDAASIAATENVNKIVSNLVSAQMTSQVFTNSFLQRKEAGATDTDALLDSLVDAMIESVTEKLSVDAILKNPNGLTAQALANSFIAEGTEEMSSAVLSTIYDELRYGDESELHKKAQQYIDAGVDEKQAWKNVLSAYAKEVLLDGLAGGISGLGMSAASELGSAVMNRQAETTIMIGLASPEGSAARQIAESIQQQMADISQKQAENAEVGDAELQSLSSKYKQLQDAVKSLPAGEKQAAEEAVREIRSYQKREAKIDTALGRIIDAQAASAPEVSEAAAIESTPAMAAEVATEATAAAEAPVHTELIAQAIAAVDENGMLKGGSINKILQDPASMAELGIASTGLTNTQKRTQIKTAVEKIAADEKIRAEAPAKTETPRVTAAEVEQKSVPGLLTYEQFKAERVKEGGRQDLPEDVLREAYQGYLNIEGARKARYGQFAYVNGMGFVNYSEFRDRFLQLARDRGQTVTESQVSAAFDGLRAEGESKLGRSESARRKKLDESVRALNSNAVVKSGKLTLEVSFNADEFVAASGNSIKAKYVKAPDGQMKIVFNGLELGTRDAVTRTLVHEIVHPATAAANAANGLGEAFIDTIIESAEKLAKGNKLSRRTAAKVIGKDAELSRLSRLYTAQEHTDAKRENRTARPEDYTPSSLTIREEYAADLLRDILFEKDAVSVLFGDKPSVAHALLDQARRMRGELRSNLTEGEQEIADELDDIIRLVKNVLAGDVKELEKRASESGKTGTAAESPGEVKHSIESIFDAGGMAALRDADSGQISFFQKDGLIPVTEVSVAQIKENSGIGLLIDTAVKNGTITEEEAKTQYESVAELFNTIINTQDPDMVWEFAGATLFSAVKTNADGQYGTTIDFTTVCRKTQDMITAMSHAMVKMKRGLTKDEVTQLQKKLLANDAQVPCPVCYVFSRWAGVGAVLDKMYYWQNKYESASDEEIKARIKQLEGLTKKADLRKQLKEDDAIYQDLAGEHEKLKQEKTKLANELKAAKKRKTQDADAQRIQKENPAQIAALEAKLAAIKKQMTDIEDRGSAELAWLLRVRTADNYEAVPPEVLFDLDAGRVFAAKYPASWAYRTSRGPGVGKAILPYSDMRLGDAILGPKSADTKDDGTQRRDLFKDASGEWTSDQQKAIDRAILRTKAQNLIGGQRFQSTSDFRYDYALDYLMAFWEMQALGSNLQTYTKVIEFVDMIAAIGGDVNMSVMPKNAGYKDGKLIFSKVTGMNIEAARRANALYDNAQMILVGINDEHIRLALEDSTETGGAEIGFVIPYHASGASIENFIAELVANLNEQFVKDNYKDYSDVQSDHSRKGATEEQARRGDIRKAILTGREDGKAWVPTAEDFLLMQGESVDISDRSFDDLRAVEKRALSGDAAAIEEYLSWSAGILQDLYDRFNGGDVHLKSTQAANIMPHEYWNKSTTRGNAYVNGFIFRSYCYSLGLTPRFTGIAKGGKTVDHGDFSDSTGYWKTLIDRPMYANDGTYRDQQKVNVTKFDAGMLTPAWAEEHWGEYKLAEPSAQNAVKAADQFVAETKYSLSANAAEDLNLVRVKNKSTLTSERGALIAPGYSEDASTNNDTTESKDVKTESAVRLSIEESGESAYEPSLVNEALDTMLQEAAAKGYSEAAVDAEDAYRTLIAVDTSAGPDPRAYADEEHVRLTNEFFSISGRSSTAKDRDTATQEFLRRYADTYGTDAADDYVKHLRRMQKMMKYADTAAKKAEQQSQLNTATAWMIYHKREMRKQKQSYQQKLRDLRAEMAAKSREKVQAVREEERAIREIQLEKAAARLAVRDERIRGYIEKNKERSQLQRNAAQAALRSKSLADKKRAKVEQEQGFVMPIRQTPAERTFRERLEDAGNSLRTAGRTLYRTFVSSTAELERFAKRQAGGNLATTYNTVLGASGTTVEHIYRDGLVSRSGDTIAASMRETFLCLDEKGKKVDDAKQNLLQAYMLFMHNTDRMSFEARAEEELREYEAENPWLKNMSSKELARLVALTEKEQAKLGKTEAHNRAVKYVQLLEARANAEDKPVLPDTEGKPLSATVSRAQAEKLAEEHPWLVKKAESIYEWWDTFMREWVVGTSVTEERYEEMKRQYPHYVPTYRVDKQGLKAARFSGLGGATPAQVVRRAKGSVLDIVNIEDSLANLVAKAVRVERTNELYQNVVDTLMLDDVDNPTYADMGFFDDTTIAGTSTYKTETGAEVEAVKPGADADATLEGADVAGLKKIGQDYRLSAWYNGELRSAYISKELYDALMYATGDAEGPAMKGLVKVGNAITGPMKTAITGINPSFALRNISRDLPTAIINSTSGLAFPKYWAQAGLDMAAAGLLNKKQLAKVLEAVDVDTSKMEGSAERYQNFKNLGGTNSSYYNDSQGFAKAMSKGDGLGAKVIGAMGAFNEATEAMTRYAEYIATLDREGDTYENRLRGIRNSAEVTVDFSRKGTVGKVLNAWIPYWNPAVQGIDKVFRSLIESPDGSKWYKQTLRTLGRAATTTIVFEALLQAILEKLERDDEWEQLTDRMKDTYYCIPLADEKKFLRIPKNREWGATLGTPFMRMLEYANGRENPFENYIETSLLPNFLPSGPTDMIGISQYIDIATNEDFAGRSIVPYAYQQGSKAEQYDADTSMLARWLSDALGNKLGAMQIDYIITDYFGDFGDLAVQLMSPATWAADPKEIWSNLLNIAKSPWVADVRYSTQITSDYYDRVEVLEQRANDIKNHGTEDEYKTSAEYLAYRAMDRLYGDQISAINKLARDLPDGAEKDAVKEQVSGLAEEALLLDKAFQTGDFTEFANKAVEWDADASTIVELLRRYQANGSTSILLGLPEATFTVGKGDTKSTVTLVGAAYDGYTARRSELANDALAELVRDPAYHALTEDEKLSTIDRLYSYATQLAKEEVTDGAYLPDAWITATEQANRETGLPVSTVAIWRTYNSTEEELNGSAKAKENIRNRMYAATEIPAEQRNRLDDIVLSDFMVIPDDVDPDYTSRESFVISQASGSVQKKYEHLPSQFNLTADKYTELYGVYNDKDLTATQKREKMATTLGDYSTATDLYDYFSADLIEQEDVSDLPSDVGNELVRLSTESVGYKYSIAPPDSLPTSYTDPNSKVKSGKSKRATREWVLTSAQQDEYARRRDQMYASEMAALLYSTEYRNASDDEKCELIVELKSEITEAVKEDFIDWLSKNVPSTPRK